MGAGGVRPKNFFVKVITHPDETFLGQKFFYKTSIKGFRIFCWKKALKLKMCDFWHYAANFFALPGIFVNGIIKVWKKLVSWRSPSTIFWALFFLFRCKIDVGPKKLKDIYFRKIHVHVWCLEFWCFMLGDIFSWFHSLLRII